MTALSKLITWQKVDYDFSYHQMEFPCNINVLITSEGRSLLPVGMCTEGRPSGQTALPGWALALLGSQVSSPVAAAG